MDQLQERFNRAMDALRTAQAEEGPLWDQLSAFGSDPLAPFNPSNADLADRWFEKKLVTVQKYADVKAAVDEIVRAGGTAPVR